MVPVIATVRSCRGRIRAISDVHNSPEVDTMPIQIGEAPRVPPDPEWIYFLADEQERCVDVIEPRLDRASKEDPAFFLRSVDPARGRRPSC